ncbi:MAG: aldo/keto reductase [Chloroflexi bacterium]|nr:aldo/keto reductase [Chloroflexota bacterium]
MHYRRLGSAGLKVSAIGLGTNQFGGKVSAKLATQIIHAALDEGINLIDTADIYQNGRSEEAIGAAIKDRRENVVIATKFRHKVEPGGPNDQGASRHHILQGVEASLRRLKGEYLDLYQIHSWDSETPLEETMRALDDLVRAGKIRYIGASNFSAWQLAQANAIAQSLGLTKFVSIQPHYHILERGIEQEMVPAAQYLGIGILPYFPLAGGFLTGKYQPDQPAPKGSRGENSPYVQKYMTANNFDNLENLARFAEAHGHTLNELAHAWLLAQPQISSVISGATKVDHVRANAKSAAWELTAEEESAVR